MVGFTGKSYVSLSIRGITNKGTAGIKSAAVQTLWSVFDKTGIDNS